MFASVASAAEELLARGYELVHGSKTEPWGQTGARLQTPEGVIVGGLLAEIRRAGVPRVVLLCSRSIVGGNAENAIVRMWMESEDALRSSGAPWPILWPSSFMSNALQWVSQLREGDVVRAPFAGVPVAAIDPFDIAAVAGVALTSGGHAARAYELSGPVPLLPREHVQILADVLQRPLRLEPQPAAQAREQMLQSEPPTFVDAFFRFYENGEFNDAVVVPTVEEITGRKMRSFEQWARANRGAFALSKFGIAIPTRPDFARL